MFKTITKSALTLSVIWLLGYPALAQETELPSFWKSPRAKAQVLVLGIFHFKDAGLDSYKPEVEIDILSKEYQDQIKEICSRLAQFKPTKIALEFKPEHRELMDKNYQAYRKGEYELKSNEINQLGYRLAHRLNLKEVIGVDTKGRWLEPRQDSEAFAKNKGLTKVIAEDQFWGENYQAFYRYEDRLKKKKSLSDYLLFINSEENLRISHGHYLVGGFKSGDGKSFPGVDGFVSQWYNRNLRIFSNVIRLIESPQERILLIMGSGHVPILKHLLESSPEVSFVPPSDYLSH